MFAECSLVLVYIDDHLCKLNIDVRLSKEIMTSLTKRCVAEFAGTLTLVAVVVGSGIMGTNLTHDTAVALLVNMFSTVFALGLLVYLLGPISGAHFNPIVTTAFWMRKSLNTVDTVMYTVAQIIGAIAGALLANSMFDLNPFQTSTHVRSSAGLWIGEVVASAGLVAVIFTLVDRGTTNIIPIAAPVWIGSAYLFTSSTSFANPAVTIGRIFSNTFAGIAPASVGAFVVAQFFGAAIGIGIAKSLTIAKEL